MKTTFKEIEPLEMGLKWKLECAVVSAWEELSSSGALEQVHIAYETGAEGRVDHLKIWSSIRRGEWDLVCDYWMLADGMHCRGMLFSQKFSSPVLEEEIDAVMSCQDDFPRLLHTSYGLIQVQKPEREARLTAEHAMSVSSAGRLVRSEGKAN